VKDYFGFVYCKVLPPDQDLYQCLPTKNDGKLVFSLCYKCMAGKVQGYCTHTDADRALTGTWCTPELHYAMDHGYQILEVYEVWHWKESRERYFAEFVDKFLKIKTEASGWPTGVVTEEEKTAYVKDVFDREGIKLDVPKIENNSGLKAIAKLMLNSFW
jgi:DNA polymerase type B, organellar and viral